jgi:transposase
MPASGFHEDGIRVQILTLWAIDWSTKDISQRLGVPPRTIQDLIRKAKDRGYHPHESLRIKKEYYEDRKRSGRPKEITPAIEQAVIQSVTRDRAGREKSSEMLAFEAGISISSVLRILHSHGFSISKPPWKPGLTDMMKAKRLDSASTTRGILNQFEILSLQTKRVWFLATGAVRFESGIRGMTDMTLHVYESAGRVAQTLWYGDALHLIRRALCISLNQRLLNKSDLQRPR